MEQGTPHSYWLTPFTQQGWYSGGSAEYLGSPIWREECLKGNLCDKPVTTWKPACGGKTVLRKTISIRNTAFNMFPILNNIIIRWGENKLPVAASRGWNAVNTRKNSDSKRKSRQGKSVRAELPPLPLRGGKGFPHKMLLTITTLPSPAANHRLAPLAPLNCPSTFSRL